MANEILAKGKNGEGRTIPDQMVRLPKKLARTILEGAMWNGLLEPMSVNTQGP